MIFPLAIQLLGIVLTALVLDQGVMLKCFLAGCLFYWSFYVYQNVSKRTPTRLDGFLLKYGFLVFFAGIYCLVLVWQR